MSIQLVCRSTLSSLVLIHSRSPPCALAAEPRLAETPPGAPCDAPAVPPLVAPHGCLRLFCRRPGRRELGPPPRRGRREMATAAKPPAPAAAAAGAWRSTPVGVPPRSQLHRPCVPSSSTSSSLLFSCSSLLR